MTVEFEDGTVGEYELIIDKASGGVVNTTGVSPIGLNGLMGLNSPRTNNIVLD